jgi:hypothetical protein
MNDQRDRMPSRPDANRPADDGARRAPLEGEVFGPGEGGPRPNGPGNVFFEFRSGEGATFQLKPVSRWKVALILTVAMALAIAIVVTFASLFVIAAAIGAVIAAVAMAVAWVKGVFRRP